MDRNEFSDRARACRARLYGVALAMLSRPEDAQDAVQDALISAWSGLSGLRNEAYFETWLTRILINRCKTLLRQRRARDEQELTENAAAAFDGVPDPDLRRALESLDTRFRLPLVMSCVLDMPITQIAQTLNIPYGAAKWRISRAKALARDYYERGGSAR